MSEYFPTVVNEFSTDTAHRQFLVQRQHGDTFVLQLHTVWDADGSETVTSMLFPLAALGPLASVLHAALLLEPAASA